MLNNHSKWSLIILIICGFTTFIFGLWTLYRELKIKDEGIVTNGVILEYHSKLKNPQGLLGAKTKIHSPIFSYVIGDSLKFRTRSSVYAEKRSFKIGDNAPIRYDPENPKNAEIIGVFPWGLILTLIGFGFIGCLLFFRKLIRL